MTSLVSLGFLSFLNSFLAHVSSSVLKGSVSCRASVFMTVRLKGMSHREQIHDSMFIQCYHCCVLTHCVKCKGHAAAVALERGRYGSLSCCKLSIPSQYGGLVKRVGHDGVQEEI